MEVDFTDLSYDVNVGWNEKGESKTILHSVSGHFASGKLTAIMGPSGAGKSTLLNVISGYKAHNGKGKIRINGGPKDNRLFKKCSRYITQEDNLPPFMTCQEAMLMAASLKLPETMTPAMRKAVVHEKLKALGLAEQINTETDKMSGGQKKRLSIALELISNPAVFFLDEPTSGLDDFSTKYTMRLLNSLARGGRTIVCTIHQPSASLMELVDNVYILAQGKCVYQGTPPNLLPFLTASGFQCPTYHNPWDYVIEVVESSESNIAITSKAMENGKISQQTLEGLSCGIKSEDSMERINARRSKLDDIYEISVYHQFMVLLSRMTKQIWRNKVGLRLQFVHQVACGLLAGCAFFGYANRGEHAFNTAKFAVGYILFHAYTNLMIPVLIFPDEIKIMKKEHFNGWYRLSAFYAAHTLAKLPGQIAFGMIFTTIVYLMSGIPLQPTRFMLFAIIGVLTVLASDALGEAVGSTVKSTTGVALAPAILAPFLGFSVYGLDFAHRISGLTKVVVNTSFMRNGVLATLLTIFGFNRDKMPCNDIYCHFKDPKKLLKYINIEGKSVWAELLPIIAAMLVLRAACYYSLRTRLKN